MIKNYPKNHETPVWREFSPTTVGVFMLLLLNIGGLITYGWQQLVMPIPLGIDAIFIVCIFVLSRDQKKHIAMKYDDNVLQIVNEKIFKYTKPYTEPVDITISHIQKVSYAQRKFDNEIDLHIEYLNGDGESRVLAVERIDDWTEETISKFLKDLTNASAHIIVDDVVKNLRDNPEAKFVYSHGKMPPRKTGKTFFQLTTIAKEKKIDLLREKYQEYPEYQEWVMKHPYLDDELPGRLKKKKLGIKNK